MQSLSQSEACFTDVGIFLHGDSVVTVHARFPFIYNMEVTKFLKKLYKLKYERHPVNIRILPKYIHPPSPQKIK